MLICACGVINKYFDLQHFQLEPEAERVGGRVGNAEGVPIVGPVRKPQVHPRK